MGQEKKGTFTLYTSKNICRLRINQDPKGHASILSRPFMKKSMEDVLGACGDVVLDRFVSYFGFEDVVYECLGDDKMCLMPTFLRLMRNEDSFDMIRW